MRLDVFGAGHSQRPKRPQDRAANDFLRSRSFDVSGSQTALREVPQALARLATGHHHPTLAEKNFQKQRDVSSTGPDAGRPRAFRRLVDVTALDRAVAFDLGQDATHEHPVVLQPSGGSWAGFASSGPAPMLVDGGIVIEDERCFVGGTLVHPSVAIREEVQGAVFVLADPTPHHQPVARCDSGGWVELEASQSRDGPTQAFVVRALTFAREPLRGNGKSAGRFVRDGTTHAPGRLSAPCDRHPGRVGQRVWRSDPQGRFGVT